MMENTNRIALLLGGQAQAVEMPIRAAPQGMPIYTYACSPQYAKPTFPKKRQYSVATRSKDARETSVYGKIRQDFPLSRLRATVASRS